MLAIRQAIAIETFVTISNVLKLLKSRPTIINIVHNRNIIAEIILKMRVHCNPNKNIAPTKCAIAIEMATTT